MLSLCMEIERNWNYGLNESYSGLVELSIDIKLINFGQMYKELYMLEFDITKNIVYRTLKNGLSCDKNWAKSVEN